MRDNVPSDFVIGVYLNQVNATGNGLACSNDEFTNMLI